MAPSHGLDAASNQYREQATPQLVDIPEPHNGQHASGQDDEVAEVVAKGHTGEYRKGRVKLCLVSDRFNSTDHHRRTIAPILPFVVITRPMIALPSTQAPMANFQLRPTAIMDEATSQFDTAHASAIQ